jgi:hypothetical protein
LQISDIVFYHRPVLHVTLPDTDHLQQTSQSIEVIFRIGELPHLQTPVTELLLGISPLILIAILLQFVGGFCEL